MADFNSIRHKDKRNRSFWYASELLPLLGSEWKNGFSLEIYTAKIVCSCKNIKIAKHFQNCSRCVDDKVIEDIKLSKLACYIVAKHISGNGAEEARNYFHSGYLLREFVVGVLAFIIFALVITYSHLGCCIR
jgi:hypothetical protein